MSERALDALSHGLEAAPDHWLVCLAHAEALHGLGRPEESQAAARRAIANAPTPEKAAHLSQHLDEILGAAAAAWRVRSLLLTWTRCVKHRRACHCGRVTAPCAVRLQAERRLAVAL